MNATNELDVSVVIVSYNTKALLRECLSKLYERSEGVTLETFVVDNASSDGSPDMVADEFPDVRLIRSDTNLGFAPASNRALAECRGRHVLLLNSDAFPDPSALRLSVEKMDADCSLGAGGARLVGRDGDWQPSSRMFPSLLNDLLVMSGLADRYPDSRFFGRFDRTWADQDLSADVDWVVGAYMIVRRDLLEQVGFLDERFFLYYEEVDLCRSIRRAGLKVRYWADVVVTHLGGESAKTVQSEDISRAGSQLTLWRMQAALLYYRKRHGYLMAAAARWLEQAWHQIRAARNRRRDPGKAEESKALVTQMVRAWHETRGGYVSPPQPW